MNAREGETLVRRYLDDRDSLDDRETAALVRWLEEDPGRVAELRSDLVLDELLSQMHAVDRRNFPAQVRQRVADWMRGEQALDERAAELRALAAGQLGEYAKRRSGTRWVGWALAVAAALACVLALPLFFLRSSSEAPSVASMTGTPWIVRDQKPSPLQPDERLQARDRLEVGDDASVDLVYRDGTRVTLRSGTSATLAPERFSAKKLIDVNQGELVADVAPQPAGAPMTFLTPHSEVRVLGTQLLLDVDRQSTRLEVRHGRVEFRRTLPPKAGQPQSTVVKTDQSAVSAPAGLALEQGLWPTHRIGLAFLHAASAAGISFDDPESGEPRTSTVTGEGRAWLDPLHRLSFDGGRFVASPEDSQTIVKSLAKSGGFSLEATTTLVRPAGGEVSLVRLGDAEDVAFEMRLRRTKVSLALASLSKMNPEARPENESAKPVEIVRELGDLPLGEPVYWTATYAEGRLHVYRDGALVLQELVPDAGRLRVSEAATLTLGPSVEQAGEFQGRLEGIAIYDRELDDREARRNSLELRRSRSLRVEPRPMSLPFEPIDAAAFDQAWEEGLAKLSETTLVFVDVRRTGASLAYISLATIIDPRKRGERERLREALLAGELSGLPLTEMPELDRLPRGELRLPAEEAATIGVASQYFIDELFVPAAKGEGATVRDETPAR